MKSTNQLDNHKSRNEKLVKSARKQLWNQNQEMKSQWISLSLFVCVCACVCVEAVMQEGLFLDLISLTLGTEYTLVGRMFLSILIPDMSKKQIH